MLAGPVSFAYPYLDAEVRPLALTAQEKRALVAFLGSLNGSIIEGSESRSAEISASGVTRARADRRDAARWDSGRLLETTAKMRITL